MKEFNIKSSTGILQRLVAEYSNLKDEERTIESPLFNKIKDKLIQKVKMTLIEQDEYYFNNTFKLADDNFNEFVTETLYHYLERYDPSYKLTGYYKPLNFDTYYLNKIKYRLANIFKQDNWQEICEANLIEKHRIRLEIIKAHEELERQNNLIREIIEQENRPVVQLKLKGALKDSFIQEFANIKEVDKMNISLILDFDINIKNICEGIGKTTGGYRWMYADEYYKIIGEES